MRPCQWTWWWRCITQNCRDLLHSIKHAKKANDAKRQGWSILCFYVASSHSTDAMLHGHGWDTEQDEWPQSLNHIPGRRLDWVSNQHVNYYMSIGKKYWYILPNLDAACCRKQYIATAWFFTLNLWTPATGSKPLCLALHLHDTQ